MSTVINDKINGEDDQEEHSGFKSWLHSMEVSYLILDRSAVETGPPPEMNTCLNLTSDNAPSKQLKAGRETNGVAQRKNLSLPP